MGGEYRRGQVHVSVIDRTKWEARKRRDECRRKKIGAEKEGDVDVKGNAINGFVRLSWLKDGRTRINEQMNESERVWEKGAPFLTVLSQIREKSTTVCPVHLFMANACLSHRQSELSLISMSTSRLCDFMCTLLDYSFYLCDYDMDAREGGILQGIFIFRPIEV